MLLLDRLLVAHDITILPRTVVIDIMAAVAVEFFFGGDASTAKPASHQTCIGEDVRLRACVSGAPQQLLHLLKLGHGDHRLLLSRKPLTLVQNVTSVERIGEYAVQSART